MRLESASGDVASTAAETGVRIRTLKMIQVTKDGRLLGSESPSAVHDGRFETLFGSVKHEYSCDNFLDQ